ncbi:MAG: riboflavin kinase [Parcubacteria group bacterium]|jgi:riboflavin kinase/FMN adenylyltransferase
MKVSGKVVGGKRKGRELGFPTANIELKDKVESGVYAGMVNFEGKKYKAGIFVSPDGKLIEAHLIGFSGDLYGEEVGIEINDKVRDAMKFKNDDELRNQIKRDIEAISNT